ncbi:MAG: hypothetical protein ABI083_13640 [Lapillicoccus sp.]
MVALAQQDAAGAFLDWGVLHVSVTNIVVIAGMVVLFALALVIPFPSHRSAAAAEAGPAAPPEPPDPPPPAAVVTAATPATAVGAGAAEDPERVPR